MAKRKHLCKGYVCVYCCTAIIFYIPAIVALYYNFLTGEAYLLGISAAYVLFWAGPFTPTIPVIFAIAIFLKQSVKYIQGKRRDDE